MLDDERLDSGPGAVTGPNVVLETVEVVRVDVELS